MSVVLIHPPISFVENKSVRGERVYTIYQPLGVLYLASALEEIGIEVKVIDALASGISLEETIRVVENEAPQVVGISASSPQIRGAVQLATRLRKEFRDRFVIALGGAHITADPGFINRFPYFDFGVLGEGEITLPKVVERVLKGEGVRGVLTGESVTNLDDLPFPARHLIDKDIYLKKGGNFAAIICTRGCPYNCLFCSTHLFGRKVRFRSPKNVVDEMEEIAGAYNQTFHFVDDTFTVNRGHTLEFCEELVDRKQDVRWSCLTRADLVNEELLRAMYRAGCRLIDFGVESGSERVRNAILRKNLSNEQIIEAFQLCSRIGIQASAYFMLGLPTETIDEMNQTLTFAMKIDANIIGVHLTKPYPGSDLFTQAVEMGVLPPDLWDRYAKGEPIENTDGQPVYVPPTLSLDDMQEMQKMMYRKFYFRPRFILHKLIEDSGSWERLRRDVALMASLFRYGRLSP